MANPFKLFRKNQKVALAGLTIVALGGFVVLPTALQMVGTGGGARNRTVVTTRAYGNIDMQALRFMRENRKGVLQFLDMVKRHVAAAGGRGQFAKAIEQRIGPASDEQLVQTWLMANRAADLGLVVDEVGINSFLSDLFEGQGSAQAVTAILDRTGMSETRLFELLHHELLAMRLENIFSVGLMATPPGQRFDYYQRVNRQATVELVAVPVDDFAAAIADPGDKVLREFFEQYKQRHFHPVSSEPGFMVPKRIAVEYLKGEYDKIVDPDAVPADKVREFYEQNKDGRYKRLIIPEPEPSGGDLSDLDGGQESLPGLNETGPLVTPIDPEDSDQEQEQPAADDSSAAGQHSPFQLTSYQQDESAEPSPDGEEDESAEPASENTPAQPPEASGAPEASEAVDQGDYMPFEQVEPQIREELARLQVDELLKPLESKMTQFRHKRPRYKADQTGSDKPDDQAAPMAFDLSALAEGKALTVHKTGWVSKLDLQQDDIGKSNVGREFYTMHAFESLTVFQPVRSQDYDGNYYLSWKVAEAEKRVPEFDDEGVRQQVLAAWQRIEARQEAERKAEQMVAIARQKGGTLAEALADQTDVKIVETEPFSWMVPRGGHQWQMYQMDLGEVKAKSNPQATASDDEEPDVLMAGNEFMRAVFGLAAGEIGVAWNAPKTVAYVVRVDEMVPPAETLRSGFLASIYRNYASAGNNDRYDLYWAWKKSLEEDAGLAWAPGFDPRDQQ